MSKEYRFLQVDVFTDLPFGGNPLAVFPEAEGLITEEMQQLAREMNLSEMTQDRPTFHAVLDDVTDLAIGLGLPPEAITETELPVQVVSTGVPQMMVPVRSLAEVRALDASQLNTIALNRVCRAVGTKCVMVFTFETERPEAKVHMRMFAPLVGVREDPATGSANGALGAYLIHHRAVAVTEPTTHIVSEQGAELGRPSALHVEVDSTDGEITAVRVGGQVVPVAEGVVRF